MPLDIKYSKGSNNLKLEYILGVNYLLLNQFENKKTIESNQLLVNGGVGIRYDFNKFVIRTNLNALFGLFASNHRNGGRLDSENNLSFFSKTILFDVPVIPSIGISFGYKF